MRCEPLLILANAATIGQLAGLQGVQEASDKQGIGLTTTDAWLDIDPAKAQAYVKELEGKGAGQQTIIKQLEGRLANKSYVDHAPEAVVTQTRDQLQAAQDLLASIEQEQKRFS